MKQPSEIFYFMQTFIFEFKNNLFFIIQQQMFNKWSEQEDMQLKRLVRLHATDWHKIQSTFSSKRTRNALIKRWHSKLKTDEFVIHTNNSSLLEQQNHPPSCRLQKLDILKQQSQKPLPTRDWTDSDDRKLKSLVLDFHTYDWNLLAETLKVSLQEVKQYWDQRVYPDIKSQKKIAGALIWTRDQDRLIYYAMQIPQYRWENLLKFLPGRSYFSLEARWKRILEMSLNNKIRSQRLDNKLDIRCINHQRRLKEYRNILNLRKKVSQRFPKENYEQGQQCD